jgi:hypothetical protein
LGKMGGVWPATPPSHSPAPRIIEMILVTELLSIFG